MPRLRWGSSFVWEIPKFATCPEAPFRWFAVKLINSWFSGRVLGLCRSLNASALLEAVNIPEWVKEWRRLADLNRRITVLQTVALPLG